MVKLGFDDKYYVEVYVHKLDTYFFLCDNFDTADDAIRCIKETTWKKE